MIKRKNNHKRLRVESAALTSNDEIVYQEIEKMYGVKTAKALRKYCQLKGKSPDKVVNDMTTDKNGMCEWDKFDVWAQKQGVRFDAAYSDADVDDILGLKKGTSGRRKGRGSARIYDSPADSDIYGEGSGSHMNEYDIIEWIYEEMYDCEWADDLEMMDDEAAFELSLPGGGAEGNVFKVSVQKIWSGKPRHGLDN